MAKDLPAITPLRAMRDQAAKFANETRGRKVAAELSDDPVEAEAQAEEYLESQPTPLLPGRVRTPSEPAVLQAEREDEIGLTPREMQAQRRAKLEASDNIDNLGDDISRMPNFYPALEALEKKYPGLGYWKYKERYADEEDMPVANERALQYLRPEIADDIRALLQEERRDQATINEMRGIRSDMREADRRFPEETGGE